MVLPKITLRNFLLAALAIVGIPSQALAADDTNSAAPKACSILDPDCEACQ